MTGTDFEHFTAPGTLLLEVQFSLLAAMGTPSYTHVYIDTHIHMHTHLND